MNIQLCLYLTKKFPKLYACVPQSKIECDDGWFRLILWLSKYLQDYTDQQNKTAERFPDKYLPIKQLSVLEIKEKSGILKFHVDGGNQHTQAVISFAEYISGYICEYSGKIDNVGFNKIGSIKTHHIEFCKNHTDFTYVEDIELRKIFSKISQEKSNQLEFGI